MRQMGSWSFSPLVDHWFRARFGAATPIQTAAWPVVAGGEHVLISSQTGSGKSLAAWLPLIDRLVRRPRRGRLRVMYVSPLRALSRDMASGLGECLDGLCRAAAERLEPAPDLRVGVRTGDTSASERAAQRRAPPDVLLTTPESLFVLLGSRAGRTLLSGVEQVIVDEVHALIGSKRGAHLSLSLERLETLSGRSVQRIGLSATARPRRLVAGFLAGSGRPCRVIASPTQPPPEVILEPPDLPLGHFAHAGHWSFVSERLQALALEPGTMLVFCNTRSMVERVAAILCERLDPARVAAHHGSIGRQRRQTVEAGLRSGTIQVVVCSSSLELGIDIGQLDRVCQLGACGAINAFRQRAGRARHRPGQRARIHAFALTLSDQLEFEALLGALDAGGLDRAEACIGPLDVLAQHVVSMVASGEADSERILAVVRRAFPWRRLERSGFQRVLEMLHEGFVPGRETGRGPVHASGAGRLAASESAPKRCLLNGGTIPEWFEYDVITVDEGRVLGRLDEEFAFESSPGQILQLGGQSWRILRIPPGQVVVEAAPEELPNLPFWFGEGPGRSDALSRAVQHLIERGGQSAALCDGPVERWLADARRCLGVLPGPDRIVLERFFDPGGDQHLVIHSLFGARINRAWGLALRKRFCRRFNFELQAAATDNGVLISLGAVHSFDLDEVVGWLSRRCLESVLTQALLDTPVFQTRLRWCANIALAIERRDFHGRVPAQIQRNQTENLIARIFPDQLACLENLAGERRIPDHPLVRQALKDCLHDYLDLAGLERVYGHLEAGRIELHGVEVAEPSGLAMALVHAPRHSFLDPAAAEERRTRTFEDRRSRGTSAPPKPVPRPESASPGAIPTEAGSLERGLIEAGFLPDGGGATRGATTAFMHLVRDCRAVTFEPDRDRRFWVHIERLPELLALWPRATIKPFISRGLKPDPLDDADEALRRLILGRARWLGAVDPDRMSQETGLPPPRLRSALDALKLEGILAEDSRGGTAVWRPRQPTASQPSRLGVT
jgi:ATP-dependent Lhr-like helicase